MNRHYRNKSRCAREQRGRGVHICLALGLEEFGDFWKLLKNQTQTQN